MILIFLQLDGSLTVQIKLTEFVMVHVQLKCIQLNLQSWDLDEVFARVYKMFHFRMKDA